MQISETSPEPLCTGTGTGTGTVGLPDHELSVPLGGSRGVVLTHHSSETQQFFLLIILYTVSLYLGLVLGGSISRESALWVS